MATSAKRGQWLARSSTCVMIAAVAGIWPGTASAQLFWPGSSEPSYTGSIAPPPPERRRIRQPAMPMADRHAEKLAAEGAKPQGPMLMAISIANQSMKVYDANGLFAETPISSGMKGHTTPMGVFSVIQKSKWHRSNIYSGAPMPYMQRLTWSGIAMHAGVLPGYPASHGCIRMPTAFAVKMWHWTRMGARVVVTPGEITPIAIDHALLASLKGVAPPVAPVAATPADAPKDTLKDTLKDTRKDSTKLETKPDTPAVAGTKTADASGSATIVATVVTDTPPPAAIKPAPPAGASKRNGAVHLFASRKDGKLYVRQNFAPLLALPITIADPDKPLGTHVFTARRDADEAKPLQWTVLTMPASARLPEGEIMNAKRRKAMAAIAPAPVAAPVTTPSEALDRLTLADADKARLMETLGDAFITGSSLVVSDQGIAGGETGEGTDFIIRLR